MNLQTAVVDSIARANSSAVHTTLDTYDVLLLPTVRPVPADNAVYAGKVSA